VVPFGYDGKFENIGGISKNGMPLLCFLFKMKIGFFLKKHENQMGSLELKNLGFFLLAIFAQW
jgi:hypothetical protein